MEVYDDNDPEETKIYVYIKNSCDNDEKCVFYKDDPLGTCTKKPKNYIMPGKICSIDFECTDGKCVNNICRLDCNDCGENQYCYSDIFEENPSKCMNFSKINEIYEFDDEGYEHICSPELFGFEGNLTCQKLGSFDDGEYADYDFKFCKSGLIDEYEGVCISVINDPICDKEDSIEVDVKGTESGKAEASCLLTIDNKYFSSLTKSKTKYWKENVLKRYNELNWKKIRKNKNFIYEGITDKKFNEYFTIYSNYESFITQNIINEDGEINKNKKCEYKFLWKYLSSNRIKVNFTYILLFLLILI